MTPQEKLNLRVQRILNDPALLKQLVLNLKGNADQIDTLLGEIEDDGIREQLRAAIEAA